MNIFGILYVSLTNTGGHISLQLGLFFFFFLRVGNLRMTPGAAPGIEGWSRVVPDSYRLKLPLWPSASCGLGAPVPPTRSGAPQLSSIVGGNPSSSLPSLVDSSPWGHARRRPFPWSASGSADPHPFASVPVLPLFLPPCSRGGLLSPWVLLASV